MASVKYACAAVGVALLGTMPQADAFQAIGGMLPMTRSPAAACLRAGRSRGASAVCSVAAAPISSMQDAVAAIGEKPWMSQNGARAITNAEVLSVTAVTFHLDTEELSSFLTRRGYSGKELEAMVQQVLVAREGGLDITAAEADLEKAANMFVQADIYKEEAEELETKANAIIEEQQKYGPDLLMLTEKAAALKEAGKDGSAEWEDVQAKLAELAAQRQALDEQWEEVNKEVENKATNSAWDREDAQILRDAALKSINAPSAEADALLASAAGVISKAEEALLQSGKAAGLGALVEGTEALENISLRPDAKASPSSLPGRLHALLTAPSKAE